MTASKSFSRKDRVAEQIRRELAELIRTELKDPRVGMISITDVEVLIGLQKASGFLRRELGKRISIHMTPQLHFVFDQSLERGADLSLLIQKAVAISEVTDPSPETDQGDK